MSRLLSRPVLVDLALVCAVAVVELADMFVFSAGGRREPFDVGLLVLSAIALWWRRRVPFACLQVIGAATIVLAVRHAPHIGLGAMAAVYAVAAWGTPRARAIAAPLLAVAVWLVPLLTADRDSIPTNAALFGAAWILGRLMRDRREQHERLLAQADVLAREREEKAILTAEVERARFAREIHDVLTHSVSVMVVQAQGAQAVGDPARVSTALARIEQTGRRALDELRSLLRTPEAGEAPRRPSPRAAHIDELVASARDAGVDVELVLEDVADAVSPSVEVSAYRIVQEALTNVLRHSGARAARVIVAPRDGELLVEISDPGVGTEPLVTGVGTEPLVVGGGRGIEGMHDRARSVGGVLEAGAVPGGGFRVRARLPLAERR